MKKCSLMLFASMGFAALISNPSQVSAATAPTLGSAANFAVLGATTVTCTVAGVVAGDVGVSPGTAITGFTGFPDCTLTGTLHAGDGTSLQAQKDAHLANSALELQSCSVTFPVGVTQLAGRTLGSGVYCSPSAALLNGTLKLTGAGPWIFRTGSTLTTGGTPEAHASVLVNGKPNCDGKGVFWQVGSSATIGVNTDFVGNILAVASIGFDPNANLAGRALALNGAVTMSGDNEISVCNSGAGCKVKVVIVCDNRRDCDDHRDCRCNGHRHGDRDDCDCDCDCDDDHRHGDHHDRDNNRHDCNHRDCRCNGHRHGDRDDDHHHR